MAAIVSSMWNSDYSYFINILLEAPFCVSTGSRNSYEIIYCVFFIVPVFFANNVFLMNLYYRFSSRTDKKLLLTLGSILALFAPVLHFASWLGMPDIFGMFFVFGIIVLLINFNQEKFEWRTAVALALLIICLTVTRRWYLFFRQGKLHGIISIGISLAYHIPLSGSVCGIHPVIGIVRLLFCSGGSIVVRYRWREQRRLRFIPRSGGSISGTRFSVFRLTCKGITVKPLGYRIVRSLRG